EAAARGSDGFFRLSVVARPPKSHRLDHANTTRARNVRLRPDHLTLVTDAGRLMPATGAGVAACREAAPSLAECSSEPGPATATAHAAEPRQDRLEQLVRGPALQVVEETVQRVAGALAVRHH